jgi:hypothetical protein
MPPVFLICGYFSCNSHFKFYSVASSFSKSILFHYRNAPYIVEIINSMQITALGLYANCTLFCGFPASLICILAIIAPIYKPEFSGGRSFWFANLCGDWRTNRAAPPGNTICLGHFGQKKMPRAANKYAGH